MTAQPAVYEQDSVRVTGDPIALSSLLASGVLGQLPRPEDPPTVINAQHASAYQREHREAAERRACPFCRDQLSSGVVLHHTGGDPTIGWFAKELTNPEWRLPTRPLPGDREVVRAERTLLFIPCRHVVWPGELTPADWAALGQLVQWARETYKSPGSGLAIRLDEPDHPGFSGRTVMHLHFHLVVPPAWPEGVENPTGQRARIVDFPFG